MDVPAFLEWDDAKAASNVHKHGLSFSEAAGVFVDPDHVVTTSVREQDGERREKIVGRIGARLFTVVFAMRDGSCRLISARRSNKSEERSYGHHQI